MSADDVETKSLTLTFDEDIHVLIRFIDIERMTIHKCFFKIRL